MNYEGLTEALSAGIGAGAIVATGMRRYWRNRERRQQVAFQNAVQKIVDASIADVISRQAQFEARQGRHLNRQDQVINEIRQTVKKIERTRT